MPTGGVPRFVSRAHAHARARARASVHVRARTRRASGGAVHHRHRAFPGRRRAARGDARAAGRRAVRTHLPARGPRALPADAAQPRPDRAASGAGPAPRSRRTLRVRPAVTGCATRGRCGWASHPDKTCRTVALRRRQRRRRAPFRTLRDVVATGPFPVPRVPAVGERLTPHSRSAPGRPRCRSASPAATLFRYLEATGLIGKTAESRIGQRMRGRETLIRSTPRGRPPPPRPDRRRLRPRRDLQRRRPAAPEDGPVGPQASDSTTPRSTRLSSTTTAARSTTAASPPRRACTSLACRDRTPAAPRCPDGSRTMRSTSHRIATAPPQRPRAAACRTASA